MGTANAAQHAQRGVALERVSDAAPLGRRRFGALPARRPRAELRLRDRRPRRRGRRGARRVRGACRCEEKGAAPRLLDVAAPRAARRRALIAPRCSRARSTYRSSTPTPASPSTGWRSEPISNAGRPRPSGSGARRMCHPNQSSASSPTSSLQHVARLAGAELDATDLVVRPRDDATARRSRRRRCRRRRDRRRRRPCGRTARRAGVPTSAAAPSRVPSSRRRPRPAARARLVVRGGRRHGDLALAVAVEVADRRHDLAEAAAGIRSRSSDASSLPLADERIQAAPTRRRRRRSPRSARRRRGRRGRRRRDRRGGRRTSRRTRPSSVGVIGP